MKKFLLSFLVLNLVFAGCSSVEIEEMEEMLNEEDEVTEEDVEEDEVTEEDVEEDEVTEEDVEEDEVIQAVEAVEWSIFSGAYFDIDYPSDFNAQGSLEPFGNTEDAYYESAFFYSPDNKVAFYVYSPLWDGEPTDFLITDEEEILDETFTETSYRTIHQWTVRSDIGEYLRSGIVTTQGTDIPANAEEGFKPSSWETTAFGISYESQEAYDLYRDQYVQFKNSLIKYAD